MRKKPVYIYSLIYELSKNSRSKKKAISRKLKISPQLVGYSTEKLKSTKQITGFTVQIDPAKFGLINVALFFVFTTFEKEKREAILSYINKSDYVVLAEEMGNGADLFVEYSVPNLSFFNKKHMEFMGKFHKEIQVLAVYPIIVKHNLSKKFLHPRSKERIHKIISGDRLLFKLQSNEKKIIEQLIRNPKATILDISKQTDLNVRTIMRIKKKLEQQQIIMGYSVILNKPMIGIKACMVLINLKHMMPKDLNRIVSFTMIVPEITWVIKILGRYSFLIQIETLKEYKTVVDLLRNQFKFHDYKVFEMAGTIKSTYLPPSLVHRVMW